MIRHQQPTHADGKKALCAAMQALREGVATEHQWSIAAAGVALALAIDRQGIVPGLRGHINAADQALQSIHTRALCTGGGRWVSVSLQYHELDALQTFMDLRTLQVRKLERMAA